MSRGRVNNALDPPLPGERGVVVAASSDGTLTGLGIRFNGAAYTAPPAIAPGN